MLLDRQTRKAGEARKPLLRHVFKRIFVDDWMLKLTALVITFALWFGVTGLSTPITKRFTIPLVPSLAPNVEIINVLIPDVDIVVSGDKRRVDQINRGDLIATLDLTDVPPGDRVISLSPDSVSVSLPQGIKLVEVQPSRIPVNLEAVEERDVEVKVVLSGETAPGTEIYSVNVLPPRIRVRGPASFVRTLENVETDPIDIAARDRDFTARQVPVSVSNPKAAVLNTVVDAIFRIGEKRIERTFTLPIPGSEGRSVSFILFGPRTLISRTVADDLRVEVTDAPDGLPRVILPPELENVVEVRRVSVR